MTTMTPARARLCPRSGIRAFRPHRRLPAPTRLGWGVLLTLLLSATVGVAVARAEPVDVVGALYAAAEIHGVAPEPLIALVRCETAGTFDPDAKGDYRWRDGRYVPTSRGAAQINDLPTGLARHFWSLGYTDRSDPEQAADYLARVASGEFVRNPPPLHPHGRVTLARWSCWR